MRKSMRTVAAVATALALVASSAQVASASFDPATLKCRTAVAKTGGKLSKIILKVMQVCHKQSAKAASAIDCNSIAAADTKGKVTKAEAKMTALGADGGKCFGLTPSDGLYYSCPAPCAGAIVDYSDVTACLICLARANGEAFSSVTNGNPASPLSNSDDKKCQLSIGSQGAKMFNAVVKDITKCQTKSEKAGVDTTDACVTDNYPSQYVNDIQTKVHDKIAASCGAADFGNLDSCATSQFLEAACVTLAGTDSGHEIVSDYLQLGAGSPPTTVTTSTTSTTLPPVQDPACPDLGTLVLYGRDTSDACSQNTDCTYPRTCDTTLGHCVSVSFLDSGWTGHGFHADINDGVTTQGHLLCPGPATSDGCGQCEVTGIDPSLLGNCRCDPIAGGTSATRTKCYMPFQNDPACGGNMCNCYFGAPFPLAAAGTPACVVNRFAEDVSGTANVDEGSGQITAHLRSIVYLGIDGIHPCPYCSGDPTPGDGVRGGTCVDGANAGASCDADSSNTSYPVQPATPYSPPGTGVNGLYSLDCFPALAKNVSGGGLAINLSQSTGTASLDAGVFCANSADGVTTDLCPCMVCTKDGSVPCSANSDCEYQGGSCTTPSGSYGNCFSNADCTGFNFGTCNVIKRCTGNPNIACPNGDADCQNVDLQPCNVSSCSSWGVQNDGVHPNSCNNGDTCNPQGDGTGLCSTGPDTKYCDAVVRADGSGAYTCQFDASCAPASIGIDGGTCTLVVRNKCPIYPIVANGAPDPQYPVGAAVFCIPPTSSFGINQSAGLPGPGRVVNQAESTLYCPDHVTQYTPCTTPGSCTSPCP